MNNDAKRIAAELVEVICFAVGFAVIAQFLERSGFPPRTRCNFGIGVDVRRMSRSSIRHRRFQMNGEGMFWILLALWFIGTNGQTLVFIAAWMLIGNMVHEWGVPGWTSTAIGLVITAVLGAFLSEFK